MANTIDNMNSYGVNWFEFDEASGDVIDSKGGAIGTVTGGVTRVAGYNGEGKALSFAGTNGYVQFNSKLFPLGKISIRLKIKMSSLPTQSNMELISNVFSTTGRGLRSWISSGGNIVFAGVYGSNGKWSFQISTPFIFNNKWHDVLFTWDGTTSLNGVKLYLDDMTTPKSIVSASVSNTFDGDFDATLGKAVDRKERYFLGELDNIEIYNDVISPIPDKILVFHKNTYIYYTKNNWNTIGSTVTSNDYIKYGLEDIKTIPNSAWSQLTGDVELCCWTDYQPKDKIQFDITTEPFTLADEWNDKQIEIIEYTDSPSITESSIALETEPFSVYDHISYTPKILIHTESTDDVIVSTTTEPFDLYDEFGDEVEVLYYTDDNSVSEANLTLEANWSPIDELKGDFEVVTWTDEDVETELKIKTIPKAQFITPIINNLHYGEIQSLVSSVISDNVSISLTRFLLSFDNGKTWMTYKYKSWKIIDTNIKANIRENGMKYDELNNITADEFLSNGFMLGYYLEDRGWTDGDEGVKEVIIKSDAYVDGIYVNDLAFYILNTTATINVSFTGNKIIGVLDDADEGKVQYRVKINGNNYFPSDGSFSPLQASPLNINLVIPDSEINIGAQNSLTVEFQDFWGLTDTWSTSFIGTPSGLLFVDETGNYYATSLGQVLKYLDIGQIIAGQTTLDYKVYVENNIGYDIRDVLVKGINPQEGVRIELSKEQSPFIALDELLFDDVFNNGDKIPFYIRLVTDLTATTTNSGRFEVRVSAERYDE